MLSECPLAANKKNSVYIRQTAVPFNCFPPPPPLSPFPFFQICLDYKLKSSFFVANQSRRSCHSPSLTTCELELNFFFCLILFRSVLYLCTFCFQTPATNCPELCPLLFRLQLEKTGRKGRIFPFFICIGQQFSPQLARFRLLADFFI